ncbi:MAG: ABC transporter ATP-binding protein [Bacillota bacterium]
MLEFREVEMVFRSGRSRKRTVRALNGVSLRLEDGEIFGLMGESGSGKSTLGKLALGLLAPTRGEICWNETCWRKYKPMPKEARLAIQGIFQNPYGAFNPRHKIAYALAEPLVRHRLVRTKEARDAAVREMLRRVSLGEECLDKYPSQLSGGQVQRLALARILLMQPRLIVADEPTTMLDLSIQAQVIRLLQTIHRETGTAFLFISHDLPVVASLARRAGIMYGGRLVEVGLLDELMSRPRHPYTHVFFAAAAEQAVPELQDGGQKDGCPYAVNCGQAGNECLSTAPRLQPVAGEHYVACHRADLCKEAVP